MLFERMRNIAGNPNRVSSGSGRGGGGGGGGGGRGCCSAVVGHPGIGGN